MSLIEAYGAALKAALGIIGFYIASGIVILTGAVMIVYYGDIGGLYSEVVGFLPLPQLPFWEYRTQGMLAGYALVALGSVVSWLSAFAVIIKTSADAGTRRLRRRINERTRSAIKNIYGRSNPPEIEEARGGEMSWRGAFWQALKLVVFIFLMNALCAIMLGLGFAGVVLGVALGGVGIFLIPICALIVVAAGVTLILFPFGAMIRTAAGAAVKRAERWEAAAARSIRDASGKRAAARRAPEEAEDESRRQARFEDRLRNREATPRPAQEASANRGGAGGDALLSKGGVEVSRTRLAANGNTYLMSAVRSCRVLYNDETQGSKKTMRAVAMLASVAAGAGVGFAQDQLIIGTGAGVALAVAFSFIKIPKYRLYELHLRAVSGEEALAVTSRDGDFIRQVERAVNEAIAARG